MDQQHTPDRPDAVKPPDGPDAAVDDAQLPVGAWAARNGPAVLMVAAVVALVWYYLGTQGMWNVALVVFGLGLVIFIHELGHFLVAKWCDVHVQTFSLGFGPALPGCSFRKGETTYKIALLPLGGYVKMVGEGDESSEEDGDPRSYKNKTVGQRMAIISAGVVMNVLLGAACFVVAFRLGVPQRAPVIGMVEAGGPAWTKGVRSGDVVEKAGDIANPYFEDLQMHVMLSREGEAVPFVFRAPGEAERAVSVVPRKGRNDSNPVIGVRWPGEMKTPGRRDADGMRVPALRGTAAEAARDLGLKPGDVVLAATDPDGGAGLADVKAGDFGELAKRVRRLAGKPMTLRVRRAGGAEEIVTAEPVGFDWDDEVIGMTDPEGDGPYAVTEIPFDPRDPQGRHRDVFEFLRRSKEMTDRPVVVRVRRKGGATADVFVPPAYHRVLPGVRMAIGPISGVREGSPAEEKGVKAKDVLVKVTLSDGKESQSFAVHPKAKEPLTDPLRLPFELSRWARGRANVTATLTVSREQGEDADKERVLSGLRWESSWRSDEELPLGTGAPLPIPELGLAYQVKATVEYVEPGSPAEKVLSAGDMILAVTFRRDPKKGEDAPPWNTKPAINLRQSKDVSPDPLPGLAGAALQMQLLEYPEVKLLVAGSGTDASEREVELGLAEDETWPLHNPFAVRGLRLLPVQDRIARADGLLGALRMGGRHTLRTIGQIYLSLRSLVTGRVSVTENLQGPIDIAVIAYRTAERGWAEFALLIGIISVNLAVVNFLPIPVLDGGHMVFLLYEKLRGRRPPERVHNTATVVGFVLLVSLMVFVIYLGVRRYIF